MQATIHYKTYFLVEQTYVWTKIRQNVIFNNTFVFPLSIIPAAGKESYIIFNLLASLASYTYASFHQILSVK